MDSTEPQLDDTTRAALERLSEREKDCLRRFLRHQTAKEMALEIGISHHAVEKRLKMARTKLGVATSLEAARLLGASEGYGRAATGSPELTKRNANEHSQWTKQPIVLGVLTMNLVAFTLVAIASQASNPAVAPDTNPQRVVFDRREIALAEKQEVQDRETAKSRKLQKVERVKIATREKEATMKERKVARQRALQEKEAAVKQQELEAQEAAQPVKAPRPD